MREILFRGKTLKGDWVEGFYYINRYRYAGGKDFIAEEPKITTGITEASGAYGERVEEIEYKIIPETVGQYTGLCDKNGKKIFEGDIVTLLFTDGFEIGVITWSVDDCRYKFDSPDGTAYGFDVTDVFEVIGNIHDNPELLKGE